LRCPFLPGDSDLNQLDKIFSVFGTPTEEIWPGVKLLPDYIQFKPVPSIPLQEIFTAAGDDLIELAESMFHMYPAKRCSATEALKMDYFFNRPAPTIGSKLPMPASHQTKEEDQPKPSLKRKMFDLLDSSNIPGKKRLQF
jgi:cyclin-dependent kinase 7